MFALARAHGISGFAVRKSVTRTHAAIGLRGTFLNTGPGESRVCQSASRCSQPLSGSTPLERLGDRHAASHATNPKSTSSQRVFEAPPAFGDLSGRPAHVVGPGDRSAAPRGGGARSRREARGRPDRARSCFPRARANPANRPFRWSAGSCAEAPSSQPRCRGSRPRSRSCGNGSRSRPER
jgi:hypothetical protein